ncbi:MAG: cob(I)yrinic acid a,c-diamide adenosyltransferase [Propionibacteriaceae bacterium]|jgi:cob(I)alamin adenosyltransferase|nr:cob(I)yrinic acid a,c-diamide adenosyltransferase [Propionibacteriaceae bacterium]
MVNLTRVYTKTGDKGDTRLVDNSLARKTDPRVDAYGTVDEANTVIGLLTTLEIPGELFEDLRLIQNELFDLGADLANPFDTGVDSVRILPEQTERLEHLIDHYTEGLPALRSFVLPGGTTPAAVANLARATVRRAERAAWAASDTYPGGVNPEAVRYLNRLSDLMFTVGRYLSSDSEVLWVPAKDRKVSGRAAKERERILAQQEQL